MSGEMFIGVDIGGTHARAALVEETGKLLHQSKIATDIALGSEQMTERLIRESLALMEAAAQMGSRVTAMGVGVAGKIDRVQGCVLFSPNLPSMKNYPLGPELQKGLKLPVAMENDANVFGMGESWLGSGRRIDNWIGVTLGTGVGGCLILGGRLWNGDDLGFVGEIGHMIVHPEGPLCACGLRGCLEAHSGGHALVEGVRRAAAEGTLEEGALRDLWKADALTPQAIFECAQGEDPTALALFERMGWALGLALANLFTVLGIRHAIIGGGVSAGWNQFIGPLRKSLGDHSSMLQEDEMTVLRSALGDDAALLGAARLAWEVIHGSEPDSERGKR